MNIPFLLGFITLAVLSSCVFTDKNTTTIDETDNSTKIQYAFIADIQQKGDSTFILADYIQYLTGDSAIAAAIREGAADTAQMDGKTIVGVPNDYYIVNSNPKLRNLRIDNLCEFDLLLWLDRVHTEKVDNSLASLKKIYQDAPFILTLDNEETVVRIEEVFIP